MNEYKLYNGKVKLCFDEKKHQYSVGGKVVEGVTSVTSVLNKPALMFWSVNMAILHLQDILKPGLSYDEIQIKEMLDGAKRAHSIKKEKAADIGSLVHAWCESWIKGENPAMPINESIRNGTEAFLAWVKKHKVKFHLSEQKIYSKKYGYAGTLDAEGLVDGKLSIIDFKTSNGIYPEMRFQVAAYQQARQEETKKKGYDRWIVRFGKDDANFEAKKLDNFKADIESFVSALNIKRRLDTLKDEK